MSEVQEDYDCVSSCAICENKDCEWYDNWFDPEYWDEEGAE